MVFMFLSLGLAIKRYEVYLDKTILNIILKIPRRIMDDFV